METKGFFHTWQNEITSSLQNKAFLDFQSQFSGSKINWSFLKIISFVNMLTVEQLLFLICCNFWLLYFVKMCPIFYGSLPTDLEIFCIKVSWSSLKMIFFFQNVTSRTTFVTDILRLCCGFEIIYFVKMCPIFKGCVLTDFEKYEKITRLPLIWT